MGPELFPSGVSAGGFGSSNLTDCAGMAADSGGDSSEITTASVKTGVLGEGRDAIDDDRGGCGTVTAGGVKWPR